MKSLNNYIGPIQIIIEYNADDTQSVADTQYTKHISHYIQPYWLLDAPHPLIFIGAEP